MYSMYDVYIFNSYPLYTWNISKMLWTTLNNFSILPWFCLSQHLEGTPSWIFYMLFSPVSPVSTWLLEFHDICGMWISFSGIINNIPYLNFTSVWKCACYLRGNCVQYTSARFSAQSFELGPPLPHPLASVAPPFGSKGETHSLTAEGVGGTQFRRGTDLWYPLYTIIPLLCIRLVKFSASSEYGRAATWMVPNLWTISLWSIFLFLILLVFAA